MGNYVEPRATVINRAESLVWRIIITIMLTANILYRDCYEPGTILGPVGVLAY